MDLGVFPRQFLIGVIKNKSRTIKLNQLHLKRRICDREDSISNRDAARRSHSNNSEKNEKEFVLRNSHAWLSAHTHAMKCDWRESLYRRKVNSRIRFKIYNTETASQFFRNIKNVKNLHLSRDRFSVWARMLLSWKCGIKVIAKATSFALTGTAVDM